MTAPTTTGRRKLNPVAEWANDTVVITRRNLIGYLRQPQVLVFIFIQPIMFVLLFGYIFGGVMDIPGISYIDFALPGIMVQSATFATIGTSVAITEDKNSGILDRFRSLPMTRSGVLNGRVIADTIRTATTVAVIFFVGVLLGYRLKTDIFHGLFAYALIIAFGFAMSWVAVYVGLSVKNAEAAQAAGFVILFPLTFISSAFVPPQTMPPVLQWLAEINPLTNLIDGVRELTLGIDSGGSITRSIIGMTVIAVVFSLLAIRKYRHLT